MMEEYEKYIDQEYLRFPIGSLERVHGKRRQAWRIALAYAHDHCLDYDSCKWKLYDMSYTMIDRWEVKRND